MSAALVQYQQTKRYFVFDVKRSDKDCLIKFIINLQVNCDYSASIIESCLRKRTWCALDTCCCCLKRVSDTAIPVIQIGDFENIDWESVLDGSQIASSYLVRKGLSRKAQLAMQIKRFSSKNRDSILKKATPFTLILETWSAFEDMRVDFGNGTFANFDTNMIMDVALRQRLEWCLEDVKLSMEDNHCDHWILKPSVTNKGVDIAIIKNWDSLLDAIEAVPDIREWVLQKYIEKPLLLKRHKFHLRVYILCIGALRVFVFEKMLILIAAHEYDLSDTDNIYGHLTNTARAAESEHFDERKFVKVLEDLPQYLCSERPDLAPNMDAANAIIVKMKQDIFSITHELFKAFENEYTVFAPMTNCFEIFGLDFMVDDELNMSLLEVNPGPDFKQTGGKLKNVISELWEQSFQLVLDDNQHLEKIRNLNHQRTYEPMQKATQDFTCVYSKESSTSHLDGGMKLV